MPKSWNAIRKDAVAFVHEWKDESSEHAEAKSFWDQFFSVFGVNRRRRATFEYNVKKASGRDGFIDVFWKGMILIEHKSRGKDLNAAHKQAVNYFPGIPDYDLPKYILVSDFARFRLYDLESGEEFDFDIEALPDNIGLFGFLAGYNTRRIVEQDPVNIKAAERMGHLHDQLKEIGYDGHRLEIYLVRLLFCLFAEDTGIFERQLFQNYIEDHTKADGSDLAYHLSALFQVLNQSENRRLKNLDESLAEFPYINGKLFAEPLEVAAFDEHMRTALLECCALDWSRISPAIFGSLFQSIMDKDKRRNLGAHYTSEENILKVINPLFMEELRSEFEKVKRSKPKLREFQKKLRSLNFLDPACGCGNFLVIAYRELRLLELEILRAYFKKGELVTDVDTHIMLDVDQFYGIEIEEFPAQIAQVALWLMDHQMNQMISNEFGQYFARIPLTSSANIVNANALRIDWNDVVDAKELNYIFGNPPFGGARVISKSQHNDLMVALDGVKNAGLLDFVTGWFVLSRKMISKNKDISVGLVSTNSIVTGEQVGVLWPEILHDGVEIQFAYRTFKWESEAKGKAAVHCIIVGFGKKVSTSKSLFDENGQHLKTSHISAYLGRKHVTYIVRRSEPLCNVNPIVIGNKPIDGGHLLFTKEEMEALIESAPELSKYLKPWLGAKEFLQGLQRWCLDFRHAAPRDLKKSKKAVRLLNAVSEFRSASKSAGTRKIAQSPTRYHVEFESSCEYLVIPEVSSERRKYIPIGFFPPDVVPSNLVKCIADATRYDLGILHSLMHNAWMRVTAGRLKSDYKYSAKIVYNNFPWPKDPTPKQVKEIETAAQKVLDAREQFPDSTLADLYDPLTMPPELLKAHKALDKTVDKAYGYTGKYEDEPARVEFLFDLYGSYSAGL